MYSLVIPAFYRGGEQIPPTLWKAGKCHLPPGHVRPGDDPFRRVCEDLCPAFADRQGGVGNVVVAVKGPAPCDSILGVQGVAGLILGIQVSQCGLQLVKSQGVVSIGQSSSGLVAHIELDGLIGVQLDSLALLAQNDLHLSCDLRGTLNGERQRALGAGSDNVLGGLNGQLLAESTVICIVLLVEGTVCLDLNVDAEGGHTGGIAAAGIGGELGEGAADDADRQQGQDQQQRRQTHGLILFHRIDFSFP